jgi:hypothetical protein
LESVLADCVLQFGEEEGAPLGLIVAGTLERVEQLKGGLVLGGKRIDSVSGHQCCRLDGGFTEQVGEKAECHASKRHAGQRARRLM